MSGGPRGHDAEPARRAAAEARADDSRRTVSVREAAPADLPRIWELVLQLADYERLSEYVTGTREQLGEWLFGGRESARSRVAVQDGRIVGYTLFYTRYSSFRTRRRLWLEDLFVDPSARGTGAGATLLRDLARVALEGGCERVDWDVLDWNQLAIDFYHRMGGAAVSKEWTQFGMGEAALRMLVAGE